MQKIANILDIPLDSFFKNNYVRPSDLEVLENTIMEKDLRIKELERQLLSMSFIVDELKSSFVK
ncbi:hypothetical protein [Pedobacter rhodius]|uniref:Transcriptional regulator n=1 Tax=Pedobacter rhodius TaxID=3004098 RepID=A0ABT4KZI2_9SPHI|nr:hypothetical protein [Pedobacter sp. SJ11]MCZ4224332.1 hypothetical protein [Pedobacter sp. SJ11]